MKNISKQNIKNIKQILSKAKKISILGHHAPDGDAVGGSLALYNVLKKAGYNVQILMPSELLNYLNFLPNADEIIIHSQEKSKAENIIEKSDVIICIDFNEAKRTEKLKNILISSKAVKIIIDHHQKSVNFADYILLDTKSSSASEVVYEFIYLLEMDSFMNKNIASCLYTGIMTDTINFSVNSSRKRTFEIVGNLLDFGVDKDKIYANIYNNYSVSRMRLAGYVLDKKMKILQKYNIAYIILSKKELEKYNYKNGDHEGFVNFPLSIKGINISCFFIEKNDFIKLSLRSTGIFDVNKLSRKYFNGGGHINAAGGKLFINIDEVENYILKVIKKINI